VDVRKIGFTGSTSVGKALAATAAGNIKVSSRNVTGRTKKGHSEVGQCYISLLAAGQPVSGPRHC